MGCPDLFFLGKSAFAARMRIAARRYTISRRGVQPSSKPPSASSASLRDVTIPLSLDAVTCRYIPSQPLHYHPNRCITCGTVTLPIHYLRKMRGPLSTPGTNMKGSAAGCARGGAPAEFETLEPFRRSCFVMGWPGGCPKIRELRYVSFIFWPGAARVSTSWKPTLPESIARWGSACMMLMASSAQL